MKLADRIDNAIDKAVGCTIAVRISKKIVVRGKIIDVDFVEMKERVNTTIAEFKIYCRCGSAEALRKFIVSMLPNGRKEYPEVLGREID